jgi:hypothetical protein
VSNLSDSTLLYRAISNKKWFDSRTKMILPVAFRLREAKGETGISTDLIPECCYQYISSCYGIIEISVGDIRSLSLEVDNNHHTHVNIINFPNPTLEKMKYQKIVDTLTQKARIYQLFDPPITK